MKRIIPHHHFYYLAMLAFFSFQCNKEKILFAEHLAGKYGKPTCVTSSEVSWSAGSGTPGFYNTTINHSQMRPRSLIKDAAGNIYFIDYGYHAIRKITTAGTVVTLAGSTAAGYVDGKGIAARFNNPMGLDLDNLGNIIVADAGNHAIRQITSDGLVSTIVGGAGAGFVDGLIADAKFNSPKAVAVDLVNNDIYVLDFFNSRIRKVKQQSKVWTVAGGGKGGDGPALSAKLGSMQDIDFNTSSIELVICSSDGKIHSLLEGRITTLHQIPYSLMAIRMDAASNIYYVTQTTAGFPPFWVRRIKRVSGSDILLGGGTGAAGYANGDENTSRFNQPAGIWVNEEGNLLHVADFGNNMVRKIAVICPK